MPFATCTSQNWAEHATQYLADFLHVLSPEGRLVYISPSCSSITGYEPADLLGCFIGDLVHPDDNILITEFFRTIFFTRTTRVIYRFLKKDKTWLVLESSFTPSTQVPICRTESNPSPRFRPHVVVLARPYLTKHKMILDSFLEHIVLYEKLQQQIRDLKNEERRDEAEALTNAQNERPFSVHQGVMSEVSQSSQIDSNNFVESVAGPGSERAVVGDLGIPILATLSRGHERPASSMRRKKRPKNEDPLICHSCATVQSPEWRRGPDGLKTLCNACGCKFIVIIVFPPT